MGFIHGFCPSGRFRRLSKDGPYEGTTICPSVLLQPGPAVSNEDRRLGARNTTTACGGSPEHALDTLEKICRAEYFKIEVLLDYARRFFVYSFNSRFQVPKAGLESFVAA